MRLIGEGLKGCRCRIHIKINNNDLFYNGILTDVDNVHVTFVDKFDMIHLFRKEYVMEISEVREDENEKEST